MRRFRILILTVVACVGVLGFVSNASAGDFADDPCPTQSGDSYLCPTATAGSSYAVDIQLKEPWPGCTSMRVSSGSLPPGLSLSSEGNIRGTPTTAGSFSFYITVSWSDVSPCVKGANSDSDRKFLINVNGAKPRLVVATGSLPDANVNQAYNAPALAASGDAVNSWTLAGGTLPPGLTLAPTGVISGTPTQGGSFGFTVQANGNGTSDTKQLSIFVIAPLELQSLVGAKAPTAGWTSKTAVNGALLTGVKAVGGRAPYTFSFTGALPPGITLNPATGALTGAGTASGRFATTITVTDAAGTKVAVPWRFTVLPLLDFAKGKGLPVGKVNGLYSARIPVTGKDASTAEFAISGKIPPGLELDETTGRLTGTLLKAGTYRLRVFAFSESGAPVSKVFVLRVRA